MIKNNVKFDLKSKCLEKGINMSKLADMSGVSRQYVNQVVTRDESQGITKTYIKLMERLGYDIVLTYVERE